MKKKEDDIFKFKNKEEVELFISRLSKYVESKTGHYFNDVELLSIFDKFQTDTTKK